MKVLSSKEVGNIEDKFFELLVWTFRNEREVATFRVDNQGNVSIIEGSVPNPDVTITGGHDLLTTALQTRSNAALPRGPPVNAVAHTGKGKTPSPSFGGRLGL